MKISLQNKNDYPAFGSGSGKLVIFHLACGGNAKIVFSVSEFYHIMKPDAIRTIINYFFCNREVFLSCKEKVEWQVAACDWK